MLDGGVDLAADGGCGLGPPAFFGEAYAVLAGDDAAPGEDLGEEFVEGEAYFFADGGVVVIGGHDVGVDVAVAGVAEAGDGEAVTLAEAGGEFGEIDEAAAGDDDVLVEFREAGALEGFGEFSAQFPEGFGFFFAVGFARCV